MKNRYQLQADVYQWVHDCFGEAACEPIERARRLAEETLECVQSAGVTKEELLRIVDFVYANEPGPLREELGDACFTLMAFAEANCLSLELAEEAAWEKAQSKTAEYWAARHQNKKDHGISQ